MSSMSLEQATAIKSRFEGKVLSQAGVTGVDVGYRSAGGQPTQELAIRVYVSALSAAPPLPKEVEGLPVDVIERRFGLQ